MASVMRPRPRILHLLSDWKWTGPAEPIVNLCRELGRHGHVVNLVCRKPPHSYPKSIVHHAAERSVDVNTEFQLDKRFNLAANLRDTRALAEFIDREDVSIVHVHTSHDHYLGSRAARKANNRPFVVRWNHTGMPLRNSIANRFLIKGHTSAWIALSPACLAEDIRAFDIPEKHGLAVEGAIDLERFDPERRFEDIRAQHGFSGDHIVAGIVARVQKHRRFDVFLGALAEAMQRDANLRAIVIGRGTHFDDLVRRPVGELGIEDKVAMPGYITDLYPDTLASLDFKVFLVPGSDGSCRAVREAMALGKPIVAARRGILPELVEDSRCGLVIDDTPENLRDAILRMASDPDMRRRMGNAAAVKARERFRIDLQAQQIADLYMRLAEGL